MHWFVFILVIGSLLTQNSDSMENGTCATIVLLFGAQVEDLNAVDLEARFMSAPELKVDDIVLTDDEYTLHRKCLIHTIFQIVI